jgi:indolepyruvate ferredoxin oxidoreductase alpha subunit
VSSAEKKLLSGNEAVARGAYEAGVHLAAAYPGTPSTEILESLAEHEEVDCQWSPNEKVALEVAAGAAMCGARSLVAMKHVGLNVASDALMTLSYTGIKGGLVVVSADDPGMHSSQNEQDNRNYAKFAKLPMLEPSDSEEARRFVGRAFRISERYDTPVLLRLTTRISHSKSVVRPGVRREPRGDLSFTKDVAKYVMVPANARVRHKLVERRLSRLAALSDRIAINRIEAGDRRLGIITSGVSYQYCKEVAPEASFLKLGMSYPLPVRKILEFRRSVRKLFVVEELDPFLEEQIRALGLKVQAKPAELRCGELNPELVREILTGKKSGRKLPAAGDGGRPPVMCAGCPHRGVFYVLSRLKLHVTGDIGCYTLGALPPLSSLDTCVCMGSAIGNAAGMNRVLPPGQHKQVVAVIGDSTFLHAGMPGLMDMAYNQTNATVIILDNGTTAMTGRQDHPGTGKTLKKKETKRVNYEELCLALGADSVEVVDPYDLEAVTGAVRRATERDGLSVIVSRRDCVLLDRKRRAAALRVDAEKCTGCRLCLRLGCPAMRLMEEGIVEIDSLLCSGCGLCRQICRVEAID